MWISNIGVLLSCWIASSIVTTLLWRLLCHTPRSERVTAPIPPIATSSLATSSSTVGRTDSAHPIHSSTLRAR